MIAALYQDQGSRFGEIKKGPRFERTIGADCVCWRR